VEDGARGRRGVTLEVPGPCAICGLDGWRPALAGRDFSIVQCRGCTVGLTRPPPVEADGHESFAEDEAYFRRFLEEQGEFRRRLAMPMLRVLERFKPSGRILDVGCGLGFFLDCAAAKGYGCVGIDTSPAATELARRAFGLDVRTGSFGRTALGPDDVFDVITMNHVLEHVSEPVAFLGSAWRALRPGGIVISGSPNFAGLLPALLRERWYGLQPSQHVWQFTPASYARLFSAAGFAVEEVRVGSMHYAPGRRYRGSLVWALARIANAVGRGDNLLLVGRRS
jgi:2-polyprenyl-3-methyl-5-hydroxy-6-metoxy-1,4-benzoquinol methylase